MLTNKRLQNFVIHATDGELGYVHELYFDDETWAIRYLTVDTGGWLGGRKVLISPFSITHTDWDARRLDVALTKKQVEESPISIPTGPSHGSMRPHTSGITGFPTTGVDHFSGGPASDPTGVELAERVARESTDSHLRSTGALTGYNIDATDGEIGHVDGFVVDDETWAIRYMEVATRNWLPGKKVLVSPEWIEGISWSNSRVRVGLSREAIKEAPEYDEFGAITREYENRLYFHYGRPPYWLHEAEHRPSYSLTGV